MIQIRKDKIDIDQAWNIVYSRLEEDGLLSRPAGRSVSSLFIHNKWIAAAMLLLVCGVTAWLLTRNQSAPSVHLLTLQNEKGAVTLVTTLEDGSIVYLADDTQLQYPESFAPEKREVRLQGNALFNVTGNRERPFLIETGLVRIEVIGTAFHVKNAGSSAFELAVEAGKVKVTLKDAGEQAYVETGETVSLLSDASLKIMKTEHPEQFSYYKNYKRFKDERLANILHVLNQENNSYILQTIPSLEDRQLTVTFSDNSPEEVAELICLALNLKYKKENNRLLISD
ncbi:MAG: FecR domain-containing protein [Tannerellaceae bacterium]|nr:FecR domain-containing protein [Tannerellaceae bacterium]